MDVEKLKQAINKYYPKKKFITELVTKDISKIQKLISEKHSQRGTLTLLVNELIDMGMQAEDLLMGRDFPCYIIQIVDYVDKSCVKVFTIYISFIYNCHSIFKLCMKSPEWVVSEMKIDKEEDDRVVSKLNNLVVKHFSSEKASYELLQEKLTDIYFKSDFTVFNGLFTTGHKII